MNNPSKEQIRRFRLHTHHLDAWYDKADVLRVAGACGLQNSPPGAWAISLQSRIPGLSKDEMRQMLETEKTLLQAFSFRGAPVVFPTQESDVFLSALLPVQDEPFVYTRGIELALRALDMPLEALLPLLKQTIPLLNGQTLTSKTTLDQTLAQWMLPLLPAQKRELWNAPSMYGNPDRQTVGGAVVSFLLRPCSLMGLVVFGKRAGVSPTFTTYQSWLSHPLEEHGLSARRLVRKFCTATALRRPRVLRPGLAAPPHRRSACGRRQRTSLSGSARRAQSAIFSCKTRRFSSPRPGPREGFIFWAHTTPIWDFWIAT